MRLLLQAMKVIRRFCERTLLFNDEALGDACYILQDWEGALKWKKDQPAVCTSIEEKRHERAAKWDLHEKAELVAGRHRWNGQLTMDMSSSYEKLFNRYHANTYFKSNTGRQWIARVEDNLRFNDWEVLAGTHD